MSTMVVHQQPQRNWLRSSWATICNTKESYHKNGQKSSSVSPNKTYRPIKLMDTIRRTVIMPIRSLGPISVFAYSTCTSDRKPRKREHLCLWIHSDNSNGIVANEYTIGRSHSHCLYQRNKKLYNKIHRQGNLEPWYTYVGQTHVISSVPSRCKRWSFGRALLDDKIKC
jgi:hypothetical protein